MSSIPDSASARPFATPALLHEERQVTDPAMWAAAGTLALFVGPYMSRLGWTVDPVALAATVAAVGVLLIVATYVHRSGRHEQLARAAYAVALLIALGFTCQATTYVCATIGGPLRDAQLAAADRALGFSWPAWNAWLGAHPVVRAALGLLYPLHVLETVVVVAVLSLRTREGADRFLRAFGIAFTIALAGLDLYPSVGANPHADSVPILVALRAGTFREFDPFATISLISMPSFPAVLAVLNTASMWEFPKVRRPLLALNLLILLATVGAGGHYLVDVLAGGAVAIAAAWCAGIVPPRGRGGKLLSGARVLAGRS